MRAGDSGPVRVLVADQRRMIRAGIRVMLGAVNGGTRIETEEAETSEEVLEKTFADHFDVVLMEFDLPGRGGIKTTELLVTRKPAIAVLGLSDRTEPAGVERMMAAGARGFLLKTIEPDTLVTAIRTAIRGGRFFSNEIALRLLEPVTLPRVAPLERLTRQEKEVFIAILSGLIDREIADRLGIGKRTVNKHRQRVKAKLGARNTVELVRAGMRLGLLSEPRSAG